MEGLAGRKLTAVAEGGEPERKDLTRSDDLNMDEYVVPVMCMTHLFLRC